MAGFLGTRVPVWDFDSVYSNADQQDMLVRNSKLGASLARSLLGENPQAPYSDPADAEGTQGSAVSDSQDEVPNVVALMRGHGMVVVAQSIEMCVLRAIYTVQNAKILQSARGMGGDVKVFTEREVADTKNTTAKGAVKPWPLWVREVESAGGLYRNLA
jgi:ribulose-5-phosphate 4-epimerase/fuculose-1-phosphate aldolase